MASTWSNMCGEVAARLKEPKGKWPFSYGIPILSHLSKSLVTYLYRVIYRMISRVIYRVI